MIIPLKDPKRRDEKVEWIKDCCISSRDDRKALYDRRRRYFLFGIYGSARTKYNRLNSHIDLVASFLYSADHARYNISAPRNSDDTLIAQATALEDDWNDRFRDCGLAYQVADAILWSLVYDSMFIKLGWNDARGDLTGKLFEPINFGVFDESEPDLDSQEAFVHSYTLPWDNACLRLMRAGRSKDIEKLATNVGPKTDYLPPVLANMLISATGGSNLGGAMQGAGTPDYQPMATYEAASDQPTARFHEVWVWDDACEDYACFTLADGIDGVLSDSRETIGALAKADKSPLADDYKSESNIFLPGEHPFVPVTPYPLYDYAWGKCHAEDLIPLQDWTTERLDQIADILERQVDPAKVFSGFMGLSDEKAGALGGPSTWVVDQLPGAKVEELSPEMPDDLFLEFKEIGAIFLEASGLTQTVAGQGAEGVRGDRHAKRLATTGSGRIKKAAVGLEQPLVKLGDVGLKLIRKNSADRLITDLGQEIVPSQVPEKKFTLRISGHSHSPLFSDEAKEDAGVLLKAQAIDREMFIRLINPPNADNMIHALRKRVKAETMMRQANPQPPRGSKPKAA